MQEEQKIYNNADENKSTTKMKKIFILVVISITMFSLGAVAGSGRIKLNNGNFSTNSSSGNQVPTDGLQEIYDKLHANFDGEVIEDDILNGLKSGMVKSVGDTHTVYLDAEETKEFEGDLEGTFEGIGAELSEENGLITIVAPIKGAPAEKAGLLAGDVIVEIDGESATDITVFEAVKKIRGEKGTDVKIGIVRDGEKLEFTITRDTIDIPSVEWRVEDGIGIIEIGRFGTDTTELTEKAATEFKDAGLKKIILDMRNNPGGLLDQSIGVANVWLERDSVVLEEKRGDEVVKTFKTKNNPIFSGVKTVVLINEGSASASEIVAGALKDSGVATLLGETSYGKGSVQQLIKLEGGGALKVTIARWFTPKGMNIDKEGIKPDTEVELTTEDREAKRDPQLDSAKDYLNN